MAAIRVENLSKRYQLGLTHDGSVREFANRLASRMLGRPKASSPENGNGEKEFWALKDVSFEVQPGEVLGVIGKNGAGKSTLLKILSRITHPTSGRVELHGRVASLLEVGTGFHPELSGRENVYLNGTILGLTKAEVARQFDAIVDFSGVEKFIDTPVKRYSSGMRVRLGFAVAAHLEPEILIIDEVLAVGDADFQSKCLGRMQQVARAGRTVLFVSHHMVAVRRLCTTGLLLRGGECVAYGKIGEIADLYSSTAHLSGEESLAIVRLDNSPEESSGIEVTDISAQSAEGEVLPVVRSWDDLDLVVAVECDEAIDGASVGITVKTLREERVFSVTTHLIREELLILPEGRSEIRLRIRQLPLAGGTYVLGVTVSRPRQRTLYLNSSFCRLSVTGKDVYGSGYALQQESSPILVNAQVVSAGSPEVVAVAES